MKHMNEAELRRVIRGAVKAKLRESAIGFENRRSGSNQQVVNELANAISEFIVNELEEKVSDVISQDLEMGMIDVPVRYEDVEDMAKTIAYRVLTPEGSPVRESLERMVEGLLRKMMEAE